MPRVLLIAGLVVVMAVLTAACKTGPESDRAIPVDPAAWGEPDVSSPSIADPPADPPPDAPPTQIPGESLDTDFAAPAVSSTNMIGPVVAGEANCEPGRIWVTPPGVYPSVDSYSREGTVVIGGAQGIAFRAHLTRWDGSRWAPEPEAYQTWKKKNVALQGDPAINWYQDDSTGAWGPGGGPFPITEDGFYAVWFDYYWFPNEYVSEGSAWGWAVHREFRYGKYNTGALPYCSYPALN